MIRKKECVAMLLAGGQGSRLYPLTRKVAKPAVPFGGKYRIIDFPLSNCTNSGIDTVGVLTQYQPLLLNDYIGNGLPWDLDRAYGGVKILPPYQGRDSMDWYLGTANAIYQNRQFVEQFDPEYVLILSGDHIYSMDYGKMLRFHKSRRADCTIAVIDVPLSEASRFGILSLDWEQRITAFAEKPEHPTSTKASMGIYVFNREKLFDYLAADAADTASAHDFGKNVIPAMLSAGEQMLAYQFDGYWKDVGTVQSLWEANMDLLGRRPAFSTSLSWRIFTRHTPLPPQYVGGGAQIRNSLVSEGCRIHGTVENSVLFPGTQVLPGAVVRNSVVMSSAVIAEEATVEYAILDAGVTIGSRAAVGGADALTVLGEGTEILPGAEIPPGTLRPEEGVGA